MKMAVRSIDQDMADEVRSTHLSPGYGHPAIAETARGTGPCRCCLRPFVPGVDQRLLFTYRPAGDGGSLMAPGPVFIHAEHCAAFSEAGFPDGLRSLPLAYEARASGGVVLRVSADPELGPERQIEALFAEHGAHWLHVRHAEAGCFIARVDRA